MSYQRRTLEQVRAVTTRCVGLRSASRVPGYPGYRARRGPVHCRGGRPPVHDSRFWAVVEIYNRFVLHSFNLRTSFLTFLRNLLCPVSSHFPSRNALEMASEVQGEAGGGQKKSDMELDWEFDIEGTAGWALSLKLSKVALQLPDEMLGNAMWLARRLQERTVEMDANASAMTFYVLADTAVSSWDPDVVAAQHVNADGLVLYGRASASKTTAMPVYHVFGRSTLDVKHFVDTVIKEIPSDKAVVILPSGSFVHSAEELRAALNEVHGAAYIGELVSENSGGGGGGGGTGGGITSNSQRGACASGSACCKEGEGGGSCENAAAAPSAAPAAETATPASSLRFGHFFVDLGSSSTTQQSEGGGSKDVEIGRIVYIGTEGAELTRLMLENPGREFLLYDTSLGAGQPPFMATAALFIEAMLPVFSAERWHVEAALAALWSPCCHLWGDAAINV
eukprot:2034698-Rhodomonas_salina.1